MTLSLVYGDAIAYDPPDGPSMSLDRVRIYQLGDGRAFLGTDTDDIAHVCDTACKNELIAKDGNQDFTWNRWTPTNGDSLNEASAYVDLKEQTDTSGKGVGKFSTIDVQSFDPGDDPYVLCANCGATLLRDDERFEAMFGRPIDG